MPGPKPLPRVVKERRGTLEKSREPKNPVTGLPPLGAPPRGLSNTERALWRWARKEGWWLRSVDAPIVKQLCEVDTDYRLARQAVRADDTSYENPTQVMWLMLKLRAERLRMYDVLCLPPTSRGKLEMPERKGDDKTAEFLFGKAKLKVER